MPQVGVYLPLYDYLLERLAPSSGFYAPLMAGSLARTVAVLCTSPLELVRTRMQVGILAVLSKNPKFVLHLLSPKLTPECLVVSVAGR